MIRYQEQLRVSAEMQKATENGDILRKNKLMKETERYDTDLKHQVAEILHMRQNLMERHQKTFMVLQEVQKKILSVKLVEWKKQQSLQFNGGQPCDGQLKKIQEVGF